MKSDSGHNRIIRLSDIILAAVLLAVGLVSFLFIPRGGTTVVIKHKDETVYRGDINIDHSFVVSGDYDNYIVIENGHAYYNHSNCPNHECEKMGSVSSAGGSASCAPNQTIIYITGESEVDVIVK